MTLNENDSITNSGEVPSDEQSDFNRYDNIVSDLDSLIGGAIGNINNRNYTNVYTTPRAASISHATKGSSTTPYIRSSVENTSAKSTGSKATKRANQKRSEKRSTRKSRKTKHKTSKKKRSNKSVTSEEPPIILQRTPTRLFRTPPNVPSPHSNEMECYRNNWKHCFPFMYIRL